jgi:hypothetical protein
VVGDEGLAKTESKLMQKMPEMTRVQAEMLPASRSYVGSEQELCASSGYASSDASEGCRQGLCDDPGMGGWDADDGSGVEYVREIASEDQSMASGDRHEGSGQGMCDDQGMGQTDATCMQANSGQDSNGQRIISLKKKPY